MPVCTECAHPAEHVYTTYKTKSNIRLGVCPRCDRFLDPLIEHPDLVLLLDLVLLKPQVFLHLLFNRGSPPFDASRGGLPPLPDRQARRRVSITDNIIKLGLISLVAETAVRLLPVLTSGSGRVPARSVTITMTVVLLESVAQHVITLGLALIALRAKQWYPYNPTLPSKDGRQVDFLPSLIPLTILYTSILPLLLQLILSLWYTPPTSIHEPLPSITSPASFLSSLPFHRLIPAPLLQIETALAHAWLRSDRIWAGTKLLGGMSAGFGLRVLLPTRPWETTGIVLAGWAGAACVAMILDVLAK
ncbi:hypothetical protein IAU60_005082 [Kwoniella sp. DSM 27419]